MNFEEICKIIFLKNKYLKSKDSKIHILCHSLHFSSSVFEGIRVYNKKPFFLEDHIERLFKSCDIMGLKLDLKKNQVTEICYEVVKKNKLNNGYIRPIVFRGAQSMAPDTKDCEVLLSVAAWKWDIFYKNPSLKLTLAKWKKPGPDVSPVAAKSSGSYQISTLAKNDAMKNGFDDVVMLDHKNYVAESSSCNIFWIKDNKVYTPTTRCSLAGITRKIVLNILKNKKIKFKVGNYRINELFDSDEVFLTGTASEIINVSQIDKRVFKKKKMTNFLKNEFDLLKK